MARRDRGGQMGLYDCEFACVNQGKWGSMTVRLYVWTRANGALWLSLYVWTRANGALWLWICMCELGRMGLCDCEFVCVNQGKWGCVTVSLYIICESGQMGLCECDCEFVCMNQGKWGTVTEFVCVNQGKWGCMTVTVSLYVWTRANGALWLSLHALTRTFGAQWGSWNSHYLFITGSTSSTDYKAVLLSCRWPWKLGLTSCSGVWLGPSLMQVDHRILFWFAKLKSQVCGTVLPACCMYRAMCQNHKL